MPGANVHRLLCVLTTGKPRRGAASDERARIEQPKYRVDGNRHNRTPRETNSRAPKPARASHDSRDPPFDPPRARRDDGFQSDRREAHRDVRRRRRAVSARASSSLRRLDRRATFFIFARREQTVARDDNHVEGAFRARASPRASSVDGTAPVARSTARRREPAPEVPRGASVPGDRRPAEGRRRRGQARRRADEALGHIRQLGDRRHANGRFDARTRENAVRARAPDRLERDVRPRDDEAGDVSGGFAGMLRDDVEAARRTFVFVDDRTGPRDAGFDARRAPPTRVDRVVPTRGRASSLAAARQPSRTGLLPAQGRCDDSRGGGAPEMVARCNLTRGAGEGRGDVYAWNLSPPSPPGARPAAGDADEDDSFPEWNPGRVTPW